MPKWTFHVYTVSWEKCEKHILKTHSRHKFLNSSSIGVAPNTQATYVRNKNRNIQGRLYTINVVKVISIPKGTVLKERICLICGSKFFPFREVPIMKRGAIKRITACSNSLPLMCVTFSAFWLRHWFKYILPIKLITNYSEPL